MISYPVDVANTRWSVLQVSTGQIIARNRPWPVADGGEIPGMDPDYIYLLQITGTPPDYDSRTHVLEGDEVVDAEANELRLTWLASPRPAEEIKQALENIETEKLEKLVGQLAREVVETRLVLGAIINYALKAQTYPPKVATMVDDYLAKAIKVWTNRDVLKAKLADLSAGKTVDPDSGWVES